MGRGQVDSKQQNSVESYGGSPMPLEGLRGSSQVKRPHSQSRKGPIASKSVNSSLLKIINTA